MHFPHPSFLDSGADERQGQGSAFTGIDEEGGVIQSDVSPVGFELSLAVAVAAAAAAAASAGGRERVGRRRKKE